MLKGKGGPSPGADVPGSEPSPGADVDGGTSPGADVAGVSPVRVQMWQRRALWQMSTLSSACTCSGSLFNSRLHRTRRLKSHWRVFNLFAQDFPHRKVISAPARWTSHEFETCASNAADLVHFFASECLLQSQLLA
jgi:hypothetical protein